MRLGDTKFFNLLALIATSSNPGRADHWQADQVSWTRERLSHRGPRHEFQIEILTLEHGGRHGWTLLAGHETWWDRKKPDPFRNGRWIHLTDGARRDALKWFAARESELNQRD